MSEEPHEPSTRVLPSGESARGLGALAPDDSVDALGMDVAWAQLNKSLGQHEESDAAQVGRFVILNTLGRGAMGVVYRAYDPKLDRKVALKFVQSGGGSTAGSEGASQVEREARAAADLNHPNIVTIYDVGIHDGRMFLAMELVEGASLRRWLELCARGWRQIVATFAEVADGLAAAHQHGIVHRDFKPDNVLMGEDQRPRVADFGLARPVEGWTAREATRAGGRSVAAGSGTAPSTLGALCGTPAYMAPEQFSGGPVGPASDQFAFCVSLYEALLGGRPFTGTTVEELAEQRLAGRPRPLPSRHGLPRRLVDAMLRGLESAAADRFPSMEALAAELRGVLAARRRRGIAAGLAGVGAVALGGGLGLSRLTAEQPCERAKEQLVEVWGEARRAQVREAFAGDAVLEGLDDYGQRWVEHRTEVCERTRVRGEQTALAMELQVACLERARARLGAVAGALSEGGEARRAPELDELLVPLASCDDLVMLERADGRLSTGSVFDTEQARALHQELDAEITRLRARGGLGQPVEAPLGEVLERARDAGLDHARAEALYALGRIAHEQGALETAAQRYEQSLRLAFATGWDRLTERVLIDRCQLLLDQGRLAEAQALLVVLEGVARRPDGRGRSREPSWQSQALAGTVALAAGEPAKAEALMLEARRRGLAERPATSDGLLKLANNLANAFQARGEYAGAAAQYEQILEVLAQRGEAEELTAAAAHANLGLAYTNLGGAAEAVEHYARALALLEARGAQAHPMAQMILNNWGMLEREQGQLASARVRQQQALSIARQSLGPEHPAIAYAEDELGAIDLVEGQLDAAAGHFSRALEVRTAAQGEEHPALATSLVGLGEVELARGEAARAEPWFRRAQAVLGQAPDDPELAVRAERGLARALAPPGSGAPAREAATRPDEVVSR